VYYYSNAAAVTTDNHLYLPTNETIKNTNNKPNTFTKKQTNICCHDSTVHVVLHTIQLLHAALPQHSTNDEFHPILVT
jgi:hypothetical protein